MTTIVTRTGKGSPLSWTEADANFINLNTDKAPIDSPDLTGVPTAPTATNGTNTTQLATTAFVQAKTASQTPSIAVGNITATNVQAAIQELDSEKVGNTGPQTMAGPLIVTDKSGQLVGFRNILINGKLTINQRGVSIAAAANGTYGPDRWKKVDASNMTQIVESGNFIPNTEYTLSGTNVTTQQIISPASGNWTLPNIPITALNVQLEQGSIATPFEQRPIGLELSLCLRYCELFGANICISTSTNPAGQSGSYAFAVPKRGVPVISKLSGWQGLVSGINTYSPSAETFAPTTTGGTVIFTASPAPTANGMSMINNSGFHPFLASAEL